MIEDSLPGDSFLQRYFKTKEIVRNGGVVSFEYQELQVDLVRVDHANYDFSYAYFSYNDLHNFIGGISKRLGLKHGHDGLFMRVMDGTNKLGDIRLTTDPMVALNFLGLSVNRYQHGFDTLEEMFGYVATSKYFNPYAYLFENINATSRIRDKKRPNYNAFLAWIESEGLLKKYPDEKIDKAAFEEVIFRTFPDAALYKTAILEQVRLKKELKEKFNGHLVRDLTGLTGADLGEFMKAYNNDFSDSFLMFATQEEINSKILELAPETKE